MPECTDYLIDFLDYIQNNLLRVNPLDRANCTDIIERLAAFIKDCQAKEGYCTKRTHTPPARSTTGMSELGAVSRSSAGANRRASGSAVPGREPNGELGPSHAQQSQQPRRQAQQRDSRGKQPAHVPTSNGMALPVEFRNGSGESSASTAHDMANVQASIIQAETTHADPVWNPADAPELATSPEGVTGALHEPTELPVIPEALSMLDSDISPATAAADEGICGSTAVAASAPTVALPKTVAVLDWATEQSAPSDKASHIVSTTATKNISPSGPAVKSLSNAEPVNVALTDFKTINNSELADSDDGPESPGSNFAVNSLDIVPPRPAKTATAAPYVAQSSESQPALPLAETTITPPAAGPDPQLSDDLPQDHELKRDCDQVPTDPSPLESTASPDGLHTGGNISPGLEPQPNVIMPGAEGVGGFGTATNNHPQANKNDSSPRFDTEQAPRQPVEESLKSRLLRVLCCGK
jgi:hypothetical protein